MILLRCQRFPGFKLHNMLCRCRNHTLFPRSPQAARASGAHASDSASLCPFERPGRLEGAPEDNTRGRIGHFKIGTASHAPL